VKLPNNGFLLEKAKHVGQIKQLEFLEGSARVGASTPKRTENLSLLQRIAPICQRFI